ncbi:MAG: helix-turn-helix transcriptional regulator [Alphaproteobacteria bacterium]|nr:helix-turn-helix transcriptional regulator [Alphaproteobacteria bacterium]
MDIIVRIDVMLAERKMKAKDLADEIGLTEGQLSKIRNGHMKGIKFDTLARLCILLKCDPGDLLKLDDHAEDTV